MTHMDSSVDLELVAERAEAASSAWAKSEPRTRAQALVVVADALMASESELVPLAARETGLAQSRLSGELLRTAVQLRLFAELAVDGGFLDVRIDEFDPEFALGVRPDLRRFRIPVGPVLNFAASNFPFAFSVAGGDTAAALAAGCAVVVKAHSGHPRLSIATAEVVDNALYSARAPDHLLQLVFGQEAGTRMLRDNRIRAASFTGSTKAGRMLSDLAAARPSPIPFYGELGSVNPVFVTQAALDQRAGEIADGYVNSVTGSAGQLCTKPGFLFLPMDHGLGERVAALAAAVPEHRMLNPSISSGYRERRDTILGTAGVEALVEGGIRVDDEAHGWVRPTIVMVTLDTLIEQRERLLDEAFGPLSIVVQYSDQEDLGEAVNLFPGELTGTVHTGSGEESARLHELVSRLTQRTGRVIFNGWPTGVAVTAAMQHGGPWPSTTNEGTTSVGTAAIHRFTRPVAFQNAPQMFLHPGLRDGNPLGVPQSLSPAGLSRVWGRSAQA